MNRTERKSDGSHAETTNKSEYMFLSLCIEQNVKQQEVEKIRRNSLKMKKRNIDEAYDYYSDVYVSSHKVCLRDDDDDDFLHDSRDDCRTSFLGTKRKLM